MLCACWRVVQRRGRNTENNLYCVASSHTSSPESHCDEQWLYWHRYPVFDLSHSLSPPTTLTVFLLSGFISSTSLSLYYYDTRGKFLLENTQEAVLLISDSFILEWPAWSPCARRKEQKLLPIVINASCNCRWHRDAVLLGARKSHIEEWKKD